MNNWLKKIFRTILPTRIFNYMKIKKIMVSIFFNLLKGYQYDFVRYYKFSFTNESDTFSKLIGRIIKEYHVIEKGMTMPNSRFGFGKDLVLSLCNSCQKFSINYEMGMSNLDMLLE